MRISAMRASSVVASGSLEPGGDIGWRGEAVFIVSDPPLQFARGIAYPLLHSVIVGNLARAHVNDAAVPAPISGSHETDAPEPRRQNPARSRRACGSVAV